MGDQVATRRSDASVVAADGAAVRNRQTWTVRAIGEDGSLTVADRQRGRVRLPKDYVARHVELGSCSPQPSPGRPTPVPPTPCGSISTEPPTSLRPRQGSATLPEEPARRMAERLKQLDQFATHRLPAHGMGR